MKKILSADVRKKAWMANDSVHINLNQTRENVKARSKQVALKKSPTVQHKFVKKEKDASKQSTAFPFKTQIKRIFWWPAQYDVVPIRFR